MMDKTIQHNLNKKFYWGFNLGLGLILLLILLIPWNAFMAHPDTSMVRVMILFSLWALLSGTFAWPSTSINEKVSAEEYRDYRWRYWVFWVELLLFIGLIARFGGFSFLDLQVIGIKILFLGWFLFLTPILVNHWFPLRGMTALVVGVLTAIFYTLTLKIYLLDNIRFIATLEMLLGYILIPFILFLVISSVFIYLEQGSRQIIWKEYRENRSFLLIVVSLLLLFKLLPGIDTDLKPILGMVLFVFLTCMMGSRAFSRETENRTHEYFSTLPVSNLSVFFIKYFMGLGMIFFLLSLAVSSKSLVLGVQLLSSFMVPAAILMSLYTLCFLTSLIFRDTLRSFMAGGTLGFLFYLWLFFQYSGKVWNYIEMSKVPYVSTDFFVAVSLFILTIILIGIAGILYLSRSRHQLIWKNGFLAFLVIPLLGLVPLHKDLLGNLSPKEIVPAFLWSEYPFFYEEIHNGQFGLLYRNDRGPIIYRTYEINPDNLETSNLKATKIPVQYAIARFRYLEDGKVYFLDCATTAPYPVVLARYLQDSQGGLVLDKQVQLRFDKKPFFPFYPYANDSEVLLKYTTITSADKRLNDYAHHEKRIVHFDKQTLTLKSEQTLLEGNDIFNYSSIARKDKYLFVSTPDGLVVHYIIDSTRTATVDEFGKQILDSPVNNFYQNDFRGYTWLRGNYAYASNINNALEIYDISQLPKVKKLGAVPWGWQETAMKYNKPEDIIFPPGSGLPEKVIIKRTDGFVVVSLKSIEHPEIIGRSNMQKIDSIISDGKIALVHQLFGSRDALPSSVQRDYLYRLP
jgi:hypothetical protein